jgi:hypothetical protein
MARIDVEREARRLWRQIDGPRYASDVYGMVRCRTCGTVTPKVFSIRDYDEERYLGRVCFDCMGR